jgi:signal recognition particle receptor subunit beta
MAVLDTATNEIVIRVVYDGAPESGKTTSLRALAGSLAQTAVTPEEDATGRTLWFDWMEYVGGRFEGSRIRCQIVSVPGQTELAARRRKILAGADVVVSVVDTSARAFPRSIDALRELRAAIAGCNLGVVLQANKRDVADAIELDEVRAALGGPTIGLVESVAADGTGIREAFVYAVRVALDRVRDLMGRGALATGKPALGSADELLAALRDSEQPALAKPAVVASDATSVAANALDAVLDAEAEATTRVVVPVAGFVPRPPDSSVPSGAIWPPVEGRAILAEVAQLQLAPHQFGNGDWVMGLGSGWRIVSRRDACYGTLDDGRAALVQWARLHAASARVLSPRRCIVLSDAGDGSWRLWQLVRVEQTLREAMLHALDDATPELTVLHLCQNGKQLLEAAARIQTAPCDLDCTLDTIGVADGQPVFIGLMPSAPRAGDRPIVVGPSLLRSQLEPVIAVARIGERGQALQGVIDRVPRPVVDRDGIMSTLVALFA